MCLSQLEPRGAHYLESRNGRLPGCQRRDQMPGSLQNSIGQFYDNEIGCSLRADCQQAIERFALCAWTKPVGNYS
ncbi:hypothetical protein SAMN06295987_11812 [Novosphingobium mathurense]|uniref:Uncharacterized protein n=1 Tax=Novosphingobium mathurense TaxID=428990 RepID=A0A1U6IW04_9SPHN|nr:hypothetical protein SAMN06295987_11812 [Novosphingobium mathurense]